MFSKYIEHGWKLCRIQPGTKGPRTQGWNLRENAVSSAEGLAGAGLMHAYSGTCALDIDDLERASAFLQEHGIDLKALLSAPDAVQIRSGRANRGKLLYALSDPLPSKVFADGAFELRCGTGTGRSAQDVLPPTIHPDTKQPYTWVGDWRKLPPLPDKLRALWVAGEHPPQVFTEREHSAELNELRDLLTRRSPDCGYDEWIRAGMACHHESGGSDEGFALWDSWSAPSDKYPGIENLRSHWISFGRSAAPVTVDSIRKLDVAAVSEFEDYSQTPQNGQDWLDAATMEAASPESPAFEFLTLPELFNRPSPKWIIPDVLPEAGLGCIYGQPGGGKTFLAVDIALSLAIGQSWRGQPSAQGSVLYVAAEDDSGVQSRFYAGLAARGVSDAPIRVLPASPVFTSPKQSEALLKAIRTLGRQGLVVVDTLAAVTPGSDENAAKDMSQLIHFCQKIHKVTGGLVMLIHHEGKTSGKGPRGWSGLHGAFDVEWEVTDQEDHREMRVSKMKNAPTGNVYSFRLSPVGSSCVVEWL